MSDRNEFRFVIDGITLDEKQHNAIALAVQQAGIEALSSLQVELKDPVFLGHAGLQRLPEWRGYVVVDGIKAAKISSVIEELGYFGRGAR